MVYCPKCGSKIPANIQASFCGECGASFNLDTRPHISSINSSFNPPKPLIEARSSPPKPFVEPRSSPSSDLMKRNSEIVLDAITRKLASDLINDFIKLKLIEENKFRILGLECLKCGSLSSLGLITHYETEADHYRYSASYKTRSIRIPICGNCRLKLSIAQDMNLYIKFKGKNAYVRPRGTGPWKRYDLWLRQLKPRN